MRRAHASQYLSRTHEPWKTGGLWRHMLHTREKVLFEKFFQLFIFSTSFSPFFFQGGALWRRVLHERDSACEAAEAWIYPLYYATTRVDSRIYHPPDLPAPPAAPSPQSYPPGLKKKWEKKLKMKVAGYYCGIPTAELLHIRCAPILHTGVHVTYYYNRITTYPHQAPSLTLQVLVLVFPVGY
jgi:hypothetical protein